jgi:hypothetical protein
MMIQITEILIKVFAAIITLETFPPLSLHRSEPVNNFETLLFIVQCTSANVFLSSTGEIQGVSQ